MITNGTQHAVDLILRLLVSPGAVGAGRVADLSQRAGRAAVAPGAGEYGHTWTRPPAGTTTCCSSQLRSSRPTLAYLIPEFHNPTGHLMPQGLREQLPAVAHRSRHRPHHRRVLCGPFAGWDDPAAGGRVRPPRPGTDRRRDDQAVLGRPAGRLDPRARAGDRAAGRPPGSRRHGRAGARPARRARTCSTAPPRWSRSAARQLQSRRDALVDAARTHLPGWSFRLPSGGVCLWAELRRTGLHRAGACGSGPRRAAGARPALRHRRHAGDGSSACRSRCPRRTSSRPSAGWPRPTRTWPAPARPNGLRPASSPEAADTRMT